MTKKISKTEQQWKDELSEEEFHVTRNKGTERAFTGKYWDHFEPGEYHCKCCGESLFASHTKFDAGCGWPSFYEALDKDKIRTEVDNSLGFQRTEILCAKCDAHLGHVFDDGPQPTGLRYCVNSVSIKFSDQSK
jgi:peptide-methionine (R)-S-oxide reductase